MKIQLMFSFAVLLAWSACGEKQLADNTSSLQSQGRYTGFSVPTANAVVPSFDWRNRHNRNWITPARNQGKCSTCGIFAAVGAVEALANIYFNQMLPKNDYSEEQIIMCQGDPANNCTMGSTDSATALSYVARVGLANEIHSPYRGEDWGVCVEKNINFQPKSYPAKGFGLLKVWGHQKMALPLNELAIKKALIQYGPLVTGITALETGLHHAMTLVGYSTTGANTSWIFKRSFFGQEQVAASMNRAFQISPDAQYLIYTAPTGTVKQFINHPPIIVQTPFDTPPYFGYYKIACEDRDKDGYYNWGMSNDGYAFCPAGTRREADCDDSNSRLGPYSTEVMGACRSI